MMRGISEEQTREIKEAFDLFDVDGSGKVDPHEMVTSLNLIGYDNACPEIKKIINRLATLKLRSIDFPTFLKLSVSEMVNRDPTQEMDKAFMRFDDDCTDRISFRNLKRAALELGEQLTTAELKEMIKAADYDNDGELSREDFYKAMENAKAND